MATDMNTALVYLDTNIVSRIADLRVTQATADAYAALSEMPGVRFVTSDKAREEIRAATRSTTGAVLQLLLSFLDKVPPQVIEEGGAIGSAPIGGAPISGTCTDPQYAELCTIFDPDDAEHILHAVRAGCAFFLTLDRSTILNRVARDPAAVSALCGPMEFVSPEGLVAAVRV